MTIRPPLLKRGNKIGIVAPSRTIDSAQIEKALEVFASWGLFAVFGKSLLGRHGYFAGTDEQRRHDLQQMIDDTDIKAIFCARGGYGMTRILDQLVLDKFLAHPKWIIGFSDITALHLAMNKLGVESIHGLMPVQYGYDGIEESLESLKTLLFDGKLSYNIASSPLNRMGFVEGEIIGGNLSLVAESLGTPTEIDTKGKILFLEEIDEYLYKIDRMLMQLKRAGKFENLTGVIMGDFSQMKDTQIPFGTQVEELISDHFSLLKIPVAFNFPVGHEARNFAIPCGRKVRLDVSLQHVTLSDQDLS